ncbi:winged helix-turn-helix transcriptional regulator [bacterium]|nr:winged helix-turn-helix transcriptional regulator [bacterium]
MKEERRRMINVFHALASESRLKILEYLSEKNSTTKELAELLDRKTSTVSKHLRILKDLGIVWFLPHNMNKIYYIKYKGIFEIIEKAEDILKRNK